MMSEKSEKLSAWLAAAHHFKLVHDQFSLGICQLVVQGTIGSLYSGIYRFQP